MNPFSDAFSALSSLEAALNREKDRLNIPEFEELKKKDASERHLRATIRKIKDQRDGQGVTKAWVKLAEILFQLGVSNTLKILAEQNRDQNGNPTLSAFFNADLPGGFVFATNHILTNWKIHLNWLISSYLPREGAEAKSHLADTFGLIEFNPSHSLVGYINTDRGQFYSDGDLTLPKVPAILSELAKNTLSNVHFYTADGGFSVAGKENLQEKLTLPLILGEVECGLRCLSTGGVFVLKIFTFFTPTLLTLLGSLIQLFTQYQLFKPMSSGPLNSEMYFIGIGYQGAPSEFVEQLKQAREILTGINYDEPTLRVPKMPLIFLHPNQTDGGISPAIRQQLVYTLTETVQKQISNIQRLLTNQPIEYSSLEPIYKQILPLPAEKRIPQKN